MCGRELKRRFVGARKETNGKMSGGMFHFFLALCVLWVDVALLLVSFWEISDRLST